jgi:hypothetical protein
MKNIIIFGLILNKIMLNNINGKMYNVIINMYDSIKSCISYNNCISNIWETELFDFRKFDNIMSIYEII